MMKKILIAVLILSLSVSLYAKPVPKKKSLINIAYEPYFFYQPVEENLTLYANLLPVSIELALSDNNGVKLTPLAGLKFYQWGARFGLLGGMLSFPVYYTKRTSSSAYSGYYTAGVISAGWNVSESYTALTAANETGIAFNLFNVSIAVAFQAGGTYFLFSNPALNKNTVQIGLLLRFGFWM
jgi:hypothetical protein